jgi:hypothetical protein
MNSTRDSTLIPVPAGEDHTGKEGYAVKIVNGATQVVDAITDIPFGVILDGATAGRSDSIAMFASAVGALPVKLDATPGTVARGTPLAITATGTFKANPGSGARVLCAVAMEGGAANELIEAALQTPIPFSS